MITYRYFFLFLNLTEKFSLRPDAFLCCSCCFSSKCCIIWNFLLSLSKSILSQWFILATHCVVEGLKIPYTAGRSCGCVRNLLGNGMRGLETSVMKWPSADSIKTGRSKLVIAKSLVGLMAGAIFLTAIHTGGVAARWGIQYTRLYFLWATFTIIRYGLWV